MSSARDRTRDAVLACCARLQAEQLVHATAGNVSARVDGEPDALAMTPTSVPYERLTRADICIVSTAGERLEGDHAPTSELPLHTLVYARRPEVGAIVHTHSPAAMTLAVLGRPLPAILTGLVAAAGGEVRVAPYAPPGSAGLADATEAALDGRGACLLSHHGLLAVGVDLEHAFLAASVVESSARVYLDARAHADPVPELPADVVAELARHWRAQWA